MGRGVVILHRAVSEDNIVKLYLDPVWNQGEKSSRCRTISAHPRRWEEYAWYAAAGVRLAVCPELSK